MPFMQTPVHARLPCQPPVETALLASVMSAQVSVMPGCVMVSFSAGRAPPLLFHAEAVPSPKVMVVPLIE